MTLWQNMRSALETWRANFTSSWISGPSSRTLQTEINILICLLSCDPPFLIELNIKCFRPPRLNRKIRRLWIFLQLTADVGEMEKLILDTGRRLVLSWICTFLIFIIQFNMFLLKSLKRLDNFNIVFSGIRVIPKITQNTCKDDNIDSSKLSSLKTHSDHILTHFKSIPRGLFIIIVLLLLLYTLCIAESLWPASMFSM